LTGFAKDLAEFDDRGCARTSARIAAGLERLASDFTRACSDLRYRLAQLDGFLSGSHHRLAESVEAARGTLRATQDLLRRCGDPSPALFGLVGLIRRINAPAEAPRESYGSDRQDPGLLHKFSEWSRTTPIGLPDFETLSKFVDMVFVSLASILTFITILGLMVAWTR
jgi:hypothetical protein